MSYRGIRSDERAVSAVVGTAILIGLMVTAVALLGGAILGTDYFDPDPQATLAYHEEADGTVTIGVEDASYLSAADTTIRLQGVGHCTDWDGSGDLERGDVTLTAFDDCPENLEEGDVIQVIGDDYLIDTYELRGVYPDYGCEAYAESVDDGDKITIESDETVACDFGSVGGRIDSEIEIKSGGRLIGDVHSMAQLKTDQGEFRGTFDTTLDGTSFDIVEADIDGDLVSTDKITIKDGGSVVTGDIDSSDEVDILPDNTVYGSIYADGDVKISENSEIGGAVHAPGHDVEVQDGVSIAGGVEADSITCKGNATVDGDACEDYDT